MFSQRHYDAIAGTIRQKKILIKDECRDSICELLLTVITMFEHDNPKFDRVKFIDACGFAIDKPEIVEEQL